MHLRPVADRFIEQAKRIRAFSSEREVIGAAKVLYPKNNRTDESNRSRLLRAYRASSTNFAQILKVHEEGGNIGAIIGALETSTLGGAPKGNINSRGKKRDFSLGRITGMWRAMTRAEQDEFLRQHNLRRSN